jgi:mannose-6-phosphate isomerase-like protein (cupin superfamily)
MEMRRLADRGLKTDYGLDFDLLLPWPELNAPFEGAWCVVHPGDASMAHDHHEYEIFIGLTGEGELVADGVRTPFRAGDIARLPPGVHHQVVNDGTADFTYYAIWWDTDMSERFVARHRETN